jgi:catechol 2,3-dioxygenase-like lactoylglutathione lyase family enzyme
MFGLGGKKHKCPITTDDKLWLEESLQWYETLLGSNFLRKQQTFLPTRKYFDISYKGTEEDAIFIMEKVSEYMDIDSSKIEVGFYSEPDQLELGEGIMTMHSDDSEITAGRYLQYDDGTKEILIEQKQLNNPTSLIATLAHELCHVKLLGEELIEENDEYLTDLAVLVYGFGIFNANTSIVKMDTWSGSSHSGWKMTGGAGYLHYKIHAFALALFANYQGTKSPDWVSYLESDIANYFRKSMDYIQHNLEDISFK